MGRKKSTRKGLKRIYFEDPISHFVDVYELDEKGKHIKPMPRAPRTSNAIYLDRVKQMYGSSGCSSPNLSPSDRQPPSSEYTNSDHFLINNTSPIDESQNQNDISYSFDFDDTSVVDSVPDTDFFEFDFDAFFMDTDCSKTESA